MSEKRTPPENLRSLRSKARLRKFGAAAKRLALIPPMTPLDVDPAILTPLPEGYVFADPQSVDGERVQRLFRDKIGWRHATKRRLREQIIRHQQRGVHVVNVAIKQEDGHLAGFATLLHKDGAGKFCNLGVDPRDRSNGLGQALVLERLRLAEAAGVTSLEIPYLEDTNTLKSFYGEHGFTELADGTLVRGINSPIFDLVVEGYNPVLDAASYARPDQEART